VPVPVVLHTFVLQGRSRSGRWLGLAALVAAALLPACRREPGSLPTGDRVVLIGVDAATWTVMQPLIDAGRLPTFRKLVSEGWSGTLRSMEPMISPAVWTTIATGKVPDQHGIHGFVVASPDHGDDVPVTSNLRHAETLWTIASRTGRRTNVIGWYVTWPVEPVNGVMVSDRFIPQDLSKEVGGPRAATLEHPGVYPIELSAELEKLRIAPDDFVDLDERAFHKTFNIYPVDASRVAIAEHLMHDRPADLTMVYIWGVDPMQHHFWQYYDPEHWVGPPATAEAIGQTRNVIPEYYEDVDGFVARLLAQTGPRDTVMIVSDHGAGPIERYDPRTGLSGSHRIDGVVMAWGNHVRNGRASTPPSVVDVTPTVLHLLGLPVGEDMKGRVITELLDPGFAASHPIRKIATYETPQRHGDDRPIPSKMDQGIRDRLRSLGYIQ
jgi:predicted AlkP superfamily phosphohydrolase/phosphomutase